jgi:Bacterial translation initiation factor IF-2 associated region
MGKDDIEPRMSFSHGRTKPVVVEHIKRRTAPPVCPLCGVTMKFVQSASKVGGELTASCPRCSKVGKGPPAGGP